MGEFKLPATNLVSFLPFDKQHFIGDLDLHAKGIATHCVDYFQLSSGFYEGLLGTLLDSPSIAIYYKRFNQTLEQIGRCPPDRYQLVFRISGQPAKLAGHQFNDGAFILAKPGALCEGLVQSNSESIVVYLCAQQFNKILNAMGLSSQQIQAAPSVSIFNDTLKYSVLQQLFLQGIHFYQQDTSELIHSKLLASYAQSIMHLLASYLLDSWINPVSSPIEQKERLVSRAQHLIRACKGIDVAPSQLALKVGVSRRKLEYLFRETFDVSPSEYIRIIKLNELRRSLSSPALQHYSIGDLAGDMEIWHLGRLSKYYRQQFGELPSATRERLISKI